MTIQSTPLKGTLIVLPLLAALILISGCSERPAAAQQTDENHREHASTATSGSNEEQNAEHEANQGSHAGPDHQENGLDGRGNIIQITEQERIEFGIELRTAGAAAMSRELSLPGEVVFDPDRVAHITPRVPGVVQQVNRRIGDRVMAGDVLAVLDSRELAHAKSAYLAAQAKLELAQSNFEREQKLFKQKISPEVEFLQAQQALRKAEIDLQLADRELHALGLSEQAVTELAEQDKEALTRYELTAPITGTIIDRHLTQGEVVPAQPNEPPFVIANVETVWVQLTVYPRNLGQVLPGQTVTIAAENTQSSSTGTIDYVSPQLRESTRTATARVVLKNKDRTWRPGQFVIGHVQVGQVEAKVVVPESAIQTIEEEPVVFVRTEDGFEPRSVEIGQRSQGRVEIIAGLEPGQQYAATNTFTLKAELGRGMLEHAGHAH